MSFTSIIVLANAIILISFFLLHRWIVKRKTKNTICLPFDSYTELASLLHDCKVKVRELELNPIRDLQKAHIDKTRNAVLLYNKKHEVAECLSVDDLMKFTYIADGHRLRYMYVNFIVDIEDIASVSEYLKLIQVCKYMLDLNNR
jgi:hypothetical protein